MREYHTHGFGFFPSEHPITLTKDMFLNLFAQAPETKKAAMSFLEETKGLEDWNEMSGSDDIETLFDEYEVGGYITDAAGVIAQAMTEVSGVVFETAYDDGAGYSVMFPATYPWLMNEKEKALTEESFTAIFSRVLGTDVKPDRIEAIVFV